MILRNQSINKLKLVLLKPSINLNITNLKVQNILYDLKDMRYDYFNQFIYMAMIILIFVYINSDKYHLVFT